MNDLTLSRMLIPVSYFTLLIQNGELVVIEDTTHA